MSLMSMAIRFMFGRGDRKRDKGLTTPEDIKRYNDLSYGPHGKWNLLDVYRPKDKTGVLPVIVNVHGGGWVYGTKEVYQYYCMSLAQKGFAVVNFNYRLAPENIYPASFEDLNRVIEWIHESAQEYGFDVNQQFLFGDSAGAQMAALYSCICTNAAYAENYEFKVPVGFVPKGLALNCGMYDFGSPEDDNKMGLNMLNDFLGKKHVNEKRNLVGPIRYMTEDFPPAYVMTATGDFMKEQAPLIIERLDQLKVSYKSKVYGDNQNEPPHVFHCNMRSEIARQCNDDTCEFIKSLMLT